MKSLLLTPYKMSPTSKLKNRIIMAPMTRRKAHLDHNPSEIMIDYYAKRSAAGLIITEGTIISKDAIGYGNVPGIFNKQHIQSWRKITDAVHRNNGLIFLQLWHCGRVSHPHFHNNVLPISASATNMNIPLGNSGYMCGASREATKLEIASLIDDYVHASQNAMEANFDGIEIHGANGYLVDQFLHYCSNQRDDEYGGTPENMARFCLEIISACGESIGIDKIGLRLSPAGHMNEIVTEDRDKYVYEYLLSKLEELDIAYIHTGIFDDSLRFSALDNKTATEFLRAGYKKTIIASGSYDFVSAENGIKEGLFDLIAMGRPFIANPNLVDNIKNNVPLKSYNPSMLHELL